ncbi:Transcriptional regulator [Novosphingobium lubricantis]
MLLRQIEKFIERTGMPVTKFGRLAAHDPRLIGDLRNGREPRTAMVERVEHFMNNFTGDVHAA